MRFPFQKPVPPVVRALQSDRAESCAALHAASFAHSWSPAEFEALLSNKATLGAAAIDPLTGQLRGFALCRIAADEAEILTIAVDGAFRKRGVGRALLTDILSRLAEWRVRSLFLEVEPTNLPAITLYSRNGFREVGQRRDYYRNRDGTVATALVLRKDLA